MKTKILFRSIMFFFKKFVLLPKVHHAVLDVNVETAHNDDCSSLPLCSEFCNNDDRKALPVTSLPPYFYYFLSLPLLSTKLQTGEISS